MNQNSRFAAEALVSLSAQSVDESGIENGCSFELFSLYRCDRICAENFAISAVSKNINSIRRLFGGLPMFFSPPGVGTPKCYAHLLGTCSSGISREHIFTESVMGKGRAIGLRGYLGVPDDTFVGLSSATAKILCTNHNSRLSLLDSEAKKFSDALDCFHAASAGTWQLNLDGPLFERWLLKVSMGYLAAGHTSLRRRYPSCPEVVAALFGIIPMVAPIGMYSMVGVDRRSDHTKEVLFRVLTVTDPQGKNRAAGAFIALHGFPFLFSFGGPFPIEDYLRRPDGTSYLDPYDCTHARASFHPPYVVLNDEGTKQLEVRFRWT